MSSLKSSMKWDEDKYGLEYDLSIFNVVAVNDFNMGAMENKGLNVFNTAYVLADEKTASDGDYERVEAVIGHEYFHNWTGNRVTCRDWFQLTLKEGLTVFRDQEFSSDMGSRDVCRIENVRGLRARQFAEDAGPMSHPIRPESYIAMDNFYTSTVYSKGSEVVRMYQTLLGVDGFRSGMDLYFSRHDGSAVTCDDFRQAMADANGADLEQFERWYMQRGTPTVSYSSQYDDQTGELTLRLKQRTPAAPENEPFHIPVSVGVIDSENGNELLQTQVLELKSDSDTFTFPLKGVVGQPVPSVLRGFSAPVKLVNEDADVSNFHLQTLAAYDTDGFNRWESGQKIFSNAIFAHLEGSDGKGEATSAVMKTFEQALTSDKLDDDSIRAYNLILPSESGLAEDMETIEPVKLRDARALVKREVAGRFRSQFRDLYDKLTEEMKGKSFSVDSKSVGKRRLRNVCLDYITTTVDRTDKAEILRNARVAYDHYRSSTTMTDKLAAMGILSSVWGSEDAEALRDEVLSDFYKEADGDALVLNKWFSVQASSSKPTVLDDVKALMKHPDFTIKNPNRCRALVTSFTMNNAAFHAANGEGYEFVASVIKDVDPLNPQVASRMCGSLIGHKRFDDGRAKLMKQRLKELSEIKDLSPDSFEVITRGLKS